MNEILLFETFDAAAFDPRLAWYCPPRAWRIANSCLVIEPDAKTDYWQKTHYGFVADNGHFLFTEVTGDVIVTSSVRFQPVNQYDQAGLMVRLSPQCWLKTSVEYEPHGPNRLGAVVTNAGYSDWSTQDFPQACTELSLRIRREGCDYIVEYLHEERWTQIRLARLHEDDGTRPVQVGVYACSPIAAGYAAAFDFLQIERGRVK